MIGLLRVNFLFAGYFFMLLLTSADFFTNLTFSKSLKIFMKTIKVSNRLATDQDRHSVGPDLGPNCLQRLSSDNKSLR